jgi:hypothetical protein
MSVQSIVYDDYCEHFSSARHLAGADRFGLGTRHAWPPIDRTSADIVRRCALTLRVSAEARLGISLGGRS